MDWRMRSIVGASLLAMEVNDDAPCLEKRGASEIIASMLAPTGERVHAIAVPRNPGTHATSEAAGFAPYAPG